MTTQSPLTVGVFAHANAGKTTLTEQLLYQVNVIPQIGRVDNGNTSSDTLGVERDRGISVQSALMTFPLGPHLIQLIDTPGHLDFSAEVESAINVLDLAVLVVSGAESIEPQTVAVWQALQATKVPTLVFVNKLDRAGASFADVLQEMRDGLTPQMVPLVGVEQFDDRDGFELGQLNTEDRISDLSQFDDVTLETYLTCPKDLTDEWLDKRVGALASEFKLIPVFGGSALKASGITELTDFIATHYPPRQWNADAELGGFVYKTHKLDSSSQLSYAKLFSGRLKNRETIPFGEETDKVKNLEVVSGIRREMSEVLEAGMIGLIYGPAISRNCPIGTTETAPPFRGFTYPVHEVLVQPADPAQITALFNAIGALAVEDPHLEPRYNLGMKGLTIRLLGELQAEIIDRTLRERFEVEAKFGTPRIIYKETPEGEGTGTAAYTESSGLTLAVRPLPTGQGVYVRSVISTDFLHLKYQKQTERLIRKYLSQGLSGWEVVDVEVTILDGRFSSAASNSSHFNIAVPVALFQALKKAGTTLLEPISRFVIKTEALHLSRILSGLLLTDCDVKHVGRFCVIEGEQPSEGIGKMTIKLARMTGGTASLSSSFSRYRKTNIDAEADFWGPDPRNEMVFVRAEMGGELSLLSNKLIKLNRATKSKQKNKPVIG